MAKQLQLTIPTPCHEDWDKMTPADKGRFCDSCQKQVVDFSNMSDRQVAEFFKKPSTGSVCGRFMSDQLDRSIEIPKKRMPWVKYFFQFAIPAFLVSIKSSAQKTQGQPLVKVATKDTAKKREDFKDIRLALGGVRPTNVKPTEEKSQLAIASDTTKNPICDLNTVGGVSARITYYDPAEKGARGYVIDSKTANALPNASVLMFSTIGEENVLVKRDGSFVLNIYRKITVSKVVISCEGYEKRELTLDEFLGAANSKHIVALEKIPVTGSEIVVHNLLKGKMGEVAIQKADEELISGQVVNEKDEPVPFASIETSKEHRGVMADENGSFIIKRNWLRKDDALFVSSTGYEKEIVSIGKDDYKAGELTVQLRANVVLSEVIVSTLGMIRRVRMVTGITVIKGQTVVAVEKNSAAIKKNDLHPDTDALFVYPNPASSGSSVHISFNEQEEGYYNLHLINLSGQMVQQKEIWIDKEARLLNVDIPIIAAGSYFLVLINKKSGKKYSEKIIIQ